MDPRLFIWYLGWTPRQLAALHSPLFTTLLQAPGGANLMWNTAIVAPAAVLWPATAAFGPIVSYNVLATGALALSAWLAFLAARRLTGSDLGAGAAGLLYGFSPYMLAQSAGHPHVTLAPYPPVVLLLLHDVLVRRRRPLLSAGLLGVASAVQLLTGEEVLALTALVTALGLLLLAALRPRDAVAGARRTLPALAVAAACFAAIAGYPLAFQLLGPQRVPGPLQPPDTYVADLLGFVVPPARLALGSSATLAEAARFSGGGAENDAYVGVPLLLLFAAAAVLRWRRPLVRWAVPLTLLVALLSLGPRLHAGGRVLPVPLPWAAIGRLPLIESALPARLALLTSLGIALVVADLVAAAARTGSRRRVAAGAAVALVLLSLVPRLPYPSTDAGTPAFFRAGGGVERVPAGGVVLVMPFSGENLSTPMYWQATAGYRFRMPDGEVFAPGPSLGPPSAPLRMKLTALERGVAAPTETEDAAQTRRALAALGVGTIVVGPSRGHDRVVRYLAAVLDRPPVRSGGVDVWWDVDSR